jgi:ribosome-associated protein
MAKQSEPKPDPDQSAPPPSPAPPRKSRAARLAEPHQVLPSINQTDPEVVLTMAVEAARSLADDKCEEVVVLDVRRLSQVYDYMVIGSGTSDRQMKSAIDHVREAGQKAGHAVFRASTDERTTWCLLDMVDIVVHVFEPNTRAHYDLEMLWGEAERIEWERPEQRSRDHAGLNPGGSPAKARRVPGRGAGDGDQE